MRIFLHAKLFVIDTIECNIYIFFSLFIQRLFSFLLRTVATWILTSLGPLRIKTKYGNDMFHLDLVENLTLVHLEHYLLSSSLYNIVFANFTGHTGYVSAKIGWINCKYIQVSVVLAVIYMLYLILKKNEICKFKALTLYFMWLNIC